MKFFFWCRNFIFAPLQRWIKLVGEKKVDEESLSLQKKTFKISFTYHRLKNYRRLSLSRPWRGQTGQDSGMGTIRNKNVNNKWKRNQLQFSLSTMMFAIVTPFTIGRALVDPFWTRSWPSCEAGAAWERLLVDVDDTEKINLWRW